MYERSAWVFDAAVRLKTMYVFASPVAAIATYVWPATAGTPCVTSPVVGMVTLSKLVLEPTSWSPFIPTLFAQNLFAPD